MAAVIQFLTETEGITCLKAWCASDNTGSKLVMEKCGMCQESVEAQALTVNEITYDKLNYIYRPEEVGTEW